MVLGNFEELEEKLNSRLLVIGGLVTEKVERWSNCWIAQRTCWYGHGIALRAIFKGSQQAKATGAGICRLRQISVFARHGTEWIKPWVCWRRCISGFKATWPSWSLLSRRWLWPGAVRIDLETTLSLSYVDSQLVRNQVRELLWQTLPGLMLGSATTWGLLGLQPHKDVGRLHLASDGQVCRGPRDWIPGGGAGGNLQSSSSPSSSITSNRGFSISRRSFVGNNKIQEITGSKGIRAIRNEVEQSVEGRQGDGAGESRWERRHGESGTSWGKPSGIPTARVRLS